MMAEKVGLIGGGNMGSALAEIWRRHYDLRVCEKDRTRVRRLRRSGLPVGPLEEVAASGIVVLAVKPQDMASVLGSLSAVLGERTLVISIAAGITTTFIERGLGGRRPVVRAMPNTPARIGEGMTALCRGRCARKTDMDRAAVLFRRVGEVVTVPEARMDAVTAVSGSGPAYVFHLAECLTAAAVAQGLSEATARKLVVRTLVGAGRLLAASREDAGELRRRVTSPGGTTEAALTVMRRRGWDRIVRLAVDAAARRSAALSRR